MTCRVYYRFDSGVLKSRKFSAWSQAAGRPLNEIRNMYSIIRQANQWGKDNSVGEVSAQLRRRAQEKPDEWVSEDRQCREPCFGLVSFRSFGACWQETSAPDAPAVPSEAHRRHQVCQDLMSEAPCSGFWAWCGRSGSGQCGWCLGLGFHEKALTGGRVV